MTLSAAPPGRRGTFNRPGVGMTEKLSLEQLRDRTDPLQGYVGRKIQHLASSNWYRVTGIHFREIDMSIEFTYQSMHKFPVAFCRPIAELLDGRFEIGGPGIGTSE